MIVIHEDGTREEWDTPNKCACNYGIKKETLHNLVQYTNKKNGRWYFDVSDPRLNMPVDKLIKHLEEPGNWRNGK